MRRWVGLDLVWLAALVGYVLAGVDRVPFHGDESTLIYMSRDYYYLVQAHDLNAVLYTDHPGNASEQELRLINGTVGKMAMGLAWDLRGLTVMDINEQWVWEWSWDQNIADGHMPTPAMLHAARMSSALLTAISVVGVFLIALLVTRHRIAAWAAGLIYVTSPAVLMNGRRAMMEGSTLCFTVLTVLAAVIVVREQARTSRRGWGLALAYILLGVMGGMAVASKHNATITVFAAFFAVLIEPLIRRLKASRLDSTKFELVGAIHELSLRKTLIMHFLRLTGASLLVILTFLAWNPAWWSDLAGMPDRVLILRRDLLKSQVAWVGGYDHVGERFAAWIEQAFAAEPQFYEVPVWGEYIGDQIDEYRASWWDGHGGGWLWGGLLIGAFGVGLWTLARRYTEGPALIVLLWAVIVMAALLIATPMNWQRYYLPQQAPISTVAGIGVGQAGLYLFQRLKEHDA